MPQGFLEQWLDPIDPSRTVDKNFDEETYEEQQRLRITTQAAIALLAHEIPRRLGADATPEELSRDKKLTKRMYHRWAGILSQWGGDYADIDEMIQASADDLRPLAAQADYDAGLEDYIAAMRHEPTTVATHALYLDKRKWGNRAANRLFNELNIINQVVVDFAPKDPDQSEEQTD